MKQDTLEKYGCLPEGIRFEMGDWVLVAPPEGTEGLDCIHGCDRKDEIGIHIQWSYTIPYVTGCPGCGETIPDEIQGLHQMANADYSPRVPKGYFDQVLKKIMHEAWRRMEEETKDFFLTGNGCVKELKD